MNFNISLILLVAAIVVFVLLTFGGVAGWAAFSGLHFGRWLAGGLTLFAGSFLPLPSRVVRS